MNQGSNKRNRDTYHGEDIQPNEIILKRGKDAPPALKTVSAPAQTTRRGGPWGRKLSPREPLFLQGSQRGERQHAPQRQSHPLPSKPQPTHLSPVKPKSKLISQLASVYSPYAQIPAKQNAEAMDVDISIRPSDPSPSKSQSLQTLRKALTPKKAPGVKDEPSPSPSVPGPRPITEGTKLFAPVPANLRASHYKHVQNREQWIKEERKRMKEAGLIPIRVLYRADGISVDWKSKVPVMSDTLLPAPVPSQNVDVVNPVKIVDARQVPEPPQTPITVTEKASSSQNPPEAILIPQPSQSVETVQNEEQMHEDAVEFLKRYIQTFDNDRSLLASAYSRIGTFSCQIHRPSHYTPSPSASDAVTHLFSGMECELKQGRVDILTALVSIDSRFRFTSLTESSDFDFEIMLLNDSLISLGCYGKTTFEHQDVGINMSFVLRDTDEDEEDKSTKGLWTPFVAIAHQITVRDPQNF